uniref:Vitellogenin domain-containing protein n=1 Tax=Esox lucius TaxID=8010 RepID=A0A6Q2X0P1_ESOLU
ESLFALSVIQDVRHKSCTVLSARFRTFKKYVYHYTTESKNGVTGKSNLSNGPKVTCQVELEVPQECSFVLHTVDCALSEVSLIDTQEGVVYRQAAGAEAFKAAMEKNPLKITWDPVTGIRLYPELDEPVNILNIKRGIISALNVPVMEEERNSLMDTVHGLCKTDYMVNTRKDTDTQLTLTRDLSQCDQFRSMKLPSSPLTLLPSLHGPLSKLIRSTQDCIYQFDNKRKHMTNAVCTEMHIFLPFSHNGIFSVVTQNLILQDSAKINNKVFVSHIKPLHMEYPEDKASAQTKDALLRTLRDLNALSSTGQGQRRPGLFQKLVSELRSLKNKTLSLAMEEMMGESSALTWQALTQCGTPECTSAILQVIKTMDSSAVVRDAIVYALSLQPSPDAHRVRDMLSLAQHKQSKSIMYALANTVRKFHPGHQTPEVKEVSKFVHTLLGDCSGDEDMTFLTLRIVGVMGKAMQSTWDVSKGMKEALINCVKKGTSLSVQKAAMQAFRLMDMDQEVRETLLEEYQDAEGPVQKRVAAYLMLFKTPDRALLSNVITTLKGEQDPQFKSFVVSHLDNIRHSDDPKMQQIKLYIKEALQDYWHPANQFSTMSRNYKMDTAMGSIKGNIIFDSTDILPKEVLFETTLNAFGYNTDMIEFGIEGNGFNPTLEALFGEQGFFPDSVSKAMFWAGDKMPDVVQRVLEKWIAPLRSERRKRQAPQELIRNIGHNFQKLVRELHSQDSPEAMAYLRILGDEVGYIKSSEIENMAQAVAMYSDVLFKIIPLKAMQSLISNTDNKLYAHYIFLDERFSLPSMSGLPLKFSLSGVFSPGAKGGLNLSPGMVLRLNYVFLTCSSNFLSLPSVGVEFITQMGIHIPEFVVAGIEMRTNMYHESSLNTKVTISRNKIKLSIPAPKETTELFSISNKLMSVSSTQTKLVPSFGEGTTDSIECKPLFTGMNICTTMHYASASSTDEAPYYPLTGESRLAVEIQPIGQVTEYTAAITSETLREGKEGRQKIDSLKLTLRAEGDEPMEATATVKYNRNKNTLTTEVQIPDYDIEAGITLAVTDSNIKGKKMRGILLDVTNHNIPQLSLVGRARLESMKNGMLQIQISFPALSSDVSASATLKKSDGLVMQLETAVNIPVMSSVQKVIVRYDENKFEVEMKSDLDSEIQKFIPNLKYYQKHLQNLIDELLDQKVAKTDMKVRHIVTKAIEASNIWLDKVAGRNKRSLSELTLPTVYQFNTEKIAISLPVPLGGKSSEELKFPTTLSIPAITIPKMNWMIPPMDIKIPTFTIPRSLDFMLPLLGLAEMTSKVNSNFYNWEASISGGNNTVDVPSYIAQYKVIAQCPVSPLSYRLEGTGMISGTMEDNLKYVVNGSLSHSFIDASFSIFKTLSVKDKLNIRASYKIEASSPLGLQTSMYYSAKSESSSKEVKGDGNLDASIRVGSLTADSTCSHNYAIRPLHREGRGEFNLRVNSPLIQAQNVIKGNYANNELSIVSKTNVQDNALKHVAELMYKDAQLSLKCDTVYNVLGSILNNNAELGISSNIIILRVESQADDLTNQAYSLLTGTLNSDGLEVNSEGLLTFKDGRGLHKATVTLDINGLVTSGINSLHSEAFLHSGFKVNIYDSNIKTENTHSLTVTLWTLVFRSKTENFICEDAYYKHDLKVNVKPFVTSVDMNNDLKLFDIHMSNEGQVKMEPTKVDLTGSARGAYGNEHELRHTYEVNFADLAGNLKYSTTGKIMESQISHNCKIEIAGFTSKTICEAKLNSESVRFDSSIRTLALPFSFTVNAIIDSDGEVDLFGKHTGQLYSKLLVKAEPLALAYSHDCRSSTTHVLKRVKSFANLNNKFEVLLTPSEQSMTLKTISKFNNHAYNQDFSTYNTAEKLGIEFAGLLSTKLLISSRGDRDKRADKGNQEFGVSGSLKYDKNSDSHIIELPFIKNLPTALELLRTTIVNSLEAIQQYIISLDFNQLIVSLRLHLDNLPQQVSDFMTKIDLENKVKEVKEKIVLLTEEYAVTVEDLEASVENLKVNFEKTLIDIASKVDDLIKKIRGSIKSGDMSAAISNVLSQTLNQLKDFDHQFKIRETIIRVIDAIEDVIRQIDLQKLEDSNVAWLGYIDGRFGVKEKLHKKISELKKVIETFDITIFFQDLRDFILSINFAKYVENLTAQIPTEKMASVLESMKDVIVNWIEEYEIPDKINVVYSYIRDLLLRYEFDQRIEIFIDETVVLINEFRIQETVQSLVDALRSINFEVMHDKCMQQLDGAVSQLKTIDFKQSINELNEYISSVIKTMKEFNYNVFVDDANQKISELTNYANNQIEAYGMVQKIEASREFVRNVQASMLKYLEQLKETKMSEVVRMMKDVIDTTALNDMKIIMQQALQDMRDRVDDMNIRQEILIYLQRASESYTNMVAYISVQFNKLIEEIRKGTKNQNVLNQFSHAVNNFLDALKTLEVDIPSFVVPLTDLVIPTAQINLNRLQDISIPSKITVPKFTILSSYTVPAITIDFEKIKEKIIAFIDQVREYDIPIPSPEAVLGDLRALYLINIPDLTFPEITILEIKLPSTNLPKLNLDNFEITILPIPEFKFPQVPTEFQIPAFGKLYGEFRVNSPHYTLVTAVTLENSTTININRKKRGALERSKFSAILTSQAKSTLDFLDYSLDAIALLEASQMETMVFTETVKVTHKAFSIDHEGSLTFSAPSAEAIAKTTAKATTEMYTADLQNNIALSLKSGISASIGSIYNHNVNIAAIGMSSQLTMSQTAAATLESGIISLTAKTEGGGKWSIQDYSDEGTHKSNVELNINVSTAKLTFFGETDSKILKIKNTINAESVIFSHFTVDARTETELPFIKSSVLILNGNAHIGDVKIVLTASHNAELMGRMSGTISNTLEFLARPFEIVFDCKNNGNGKVVFPLKLTGRFDLENDFGVIFNSEIQNVNWASLARFNQYTYYTNFTMVNHQKDIAIYAAMNGEANLDFLTIPLTIPEMTVPYLNMKTPHIKELSLWTHVGLKELLTTPQQSFDMNLKLQYQKNPDMHTVHYDLQNFYNAITMGNMTFNFSFKSTVITLTANAGLYNQSDIIVRFGSTSTSVFNILKGKIDGSTSLTRSRGLKLATAFSWEHQNIEGSHNCTVNLSKRSMETSLVTIAKVNLPFTSLELIQDYHGNTKTKPNVASKMSLKYMFNIPLIEAEGMGNIDQNLALEGLTSSFVSLETSTKGKTDIKVGRINYNGAVDNDATVYLNAKGLQSTVKMDIASKLIYDKSTIFSLDINENLDLQASLRGVYATLNHNCNIMLKIVWGVFDTNGKHNVKATLDLDPLTRLTALMDVDATQQFDYMGHRSEAEILQKFSLSITADKQTFSWNVSSPIYNVTSTATLENKQPNVFTSLKSNCSSTIIFLEYDLDASGTLRFENGAISLNGKCNLVHSDVNVDWQHIFSQNLSVSRHTLNVDITSPTFIDVSFRYASRKDGISISVASPSVGFLGLLITRRSSSQVYGKLFSRYLSTPDKDTDIVSVKAALKNSENLSFQVVWNMDAMHSSTEGLKERIPAITDALLKFINKYHTAHFGFNINRANIKLKNSVSKVIERAHNDISKVLDTLQNTLRVMFTNAADSIPSINITELSDTFVSVLMFLHETNFTLPWIEERLSGQEIYEKASRSVSAATKGAVQRFSNLMDAITDIIERYIKGIQFTMPSSNVVINGNQIVANLRSALSVVKGQITEATRILEDVSLEELIQKVNSLLQLNLQRARDFLASLKTLDMEEMLNSLERYMHVARSQASKYNDYAKVKIQEIYNKVTMEQMNNDLTELVNILQSYYFRALNGFIDLMRQASQSAAPYIKITTKKLDVDIPLPFFWRSFNEWPALIRQ